MVRIGPDPPLLFGGSSATPGGERARLPYGRRGGGGERSCGNLRVRRRSCCGSRSRRRCRLKLSAPARNTVQAKSSSPNALVLGEVDLPTSYTRGCCLANRSPAEAGAGIAGTVAKTDVLATTDHRKQHPPLKAGALRNRNHGCSFITL